MATHNLQLLFFMGITIQPVPFYSKAHEIIYTHNVSSTANLNVMVGASVDKKKDNNT